MQERRYYFQDSGGMNKAWIGFVVMGLVVFLVFWLLSSLYKIFWYASPVFIIATLIIDRQVVLRYLRMVGRVFRRNALTGILLIVLSIFVFPFLSAGMLVNAILNRKLKAKAKEYGYRPANEGFTDYEEMDITEKPQSSPEKEYDVLFRKNETELK